ncbi:hypothetical protein SDC9_189118 [bioreactor metagenome]|uniref:Uncharacterized protein n=1 Tax=bioreactor metagenome TaxID=1076179 RepID=A0A645HRA0_9ZZZZ
MNAGGHDQAEDIFLESGKVIRDPVGSIQAQIFFQAGDTQVHAYQQHFLVQQRHADSHVDSYERLSFTRHG